jgi:hypothetical protein
MAIGSRRRVVVAVVSLAVVVSAVVIGLVSAGGSSAGPSVAATVPDGGAPTTVVTPPGSTAVTTAPTTPAGPPTAADIAAARACQAFVVYLEDAQTGRVPAAAGRTLIADVAVLLKGAKKGQSSTKALPPWAALASDLLAAANDVVSHKSAALKTDGASAGAQCQSIPAAAAQAGGFERTG